MVALGARLATPERGSGPGSILLAIVGVAFLAIFFAWLVRSRRRERRAAERERLARAAAVRQAAARLGLEYSEHAPAGLPPDSTWSGLSNFVSGRWKGISMVEADSTTVYKGRAYHHSFVAGDISANLPRISITYAPADARLGEHLHPGRLHLESEDFERAFRIGAEDKEFATGLLDPRMMMWLLGKGDTADWELAGSWARVSRSERVEPGGIRGLLDLCAEFIRHIPKVVLSERPPLASRSDGPPPAAPRA
ncbi:MAG: hypothetical protein ACJ77A_18585 [Actinomycetota bacterium]